MKKLIFLLTMLITVSIYGQSVIVGMGVDNNNNGFGQIGVKCDFLFLKMKDGVDYVSGDVAVSLPLFKKTHSFDLYTGLSIIDEEKYHNKYMKMMVGGLLNLKISDKLGFVLLSESYIRENYVFDYNLSGSFLIKL